MSWHLVSWHFYWKWETSLTMHCPIIRWLWITILVYFYVRNTNFEKKSCVLTAVWFLIEWAWSLFRHGFFNPIISFIRNTDKKGTFELKNHLVLGLRTLLDVLARILIFGCYLYVSHDGNFPAWIATVAYYICFLILLIPNLLIARVSYRSKQLYCELVICHSIVDKWIGRQSLLLL